MPRTKTINYDGDTYDWTPGVSLISRSVKPTKPLYTEPVRRAKVIGVGDALDRVAKKKRKPKNAVTIATVRG